MANYSKIDITEIIKGDAFKADFKIELSEVNLTGKKIKSQVRESSDSPPVLEFKTDDNSIVIVGQYISLIKKANEMNLMAGRYVYDLQVYTNEYDVLTLFGGEFRIKQDITQ
jgi:hypothetical protein